MADQRADQIQQRLDWLELNRRRYEGATANFKDPEKMRTLFVEVIPKAIDEVMSYDPSEDPERVAVAACAKAQLRFATLTADIEFIEDYEERREIVQNLEDQMRADAGEGNTTAEEGEPNVGDLPPTG